MECSTCKAAEAIGACAECRSALCDGCGQTCQRCKKLVCSKHVGRTPGGRLLCSTCLEARSAAVERKRREKQEAARSKTERAPSPTAGEDDTSFAALAGDEPAWISAPVDEPPEEEDKKESDEDEDFVAEKESPKDEAKRDPFDVSGKLDLGHVDEKRPILTASMGNEPKLWKFPVTFIFFLAACWFVYDRVVFIRPFLLLAAGTGILVFVVWAIRVMIARSQRHTPHK